MVGLKEIELNDIEILFNLIETNRACLRENFPVTIGEVQDAKSAEIFVKTKIEERGNRLGYYFLIQYNNEVCGIINIKNIDWRTPKAELAYFVDKNLQGRQIATTSIKQIIDYSFQQLKLRKLYACIEPRNIGSKKAVIKNGFVLEGILKSNFRNGFDKICDSEYYGLLNNSL